MKYYLIIRDYPKENSYVKYTVEVDELPRKGEQIDFEVKQDKCDLELLVTGVKYSLLDITKKLTENEAPEDDEPMVVTHVISKRSSNNG